MKLINLRSISALIFFIGVLVFVRCAKEETQKVANQICENSHSNKTFSSGYIGQMHNVLLDRIYNEFLPNYQLPTGVILEFDKLLDFLFDQPETQGLTDYEKSCIRTLFNSFNAQDDTFNKFTIYLEESVSQIYGVPFENIEQGVIGNGITQDLLDASHSIKRNSEMYWKVKHPNAKVCVSCADFAGGAWGFFFGGVGSFVVGGAASMAAELMTGCDFDATIYDGRILTPKDC